LLLGTLEEPITICDTDVALLRADDTVSDARISVVLNECHVRS